MINSDYNTSNTLSITPSNTPVNNYKNLTTEELIVLAIDFVKQGHSFPEEIRLRLYDLGILHLIDPKGLTDED